MILTKGALLDLEVTEGSKIFQIYSARLTVSNCEARCISTHNGNLFQISSPEPSPPTWQPSMLRAIEW